MRKPNALLHMTLYGLIYGLLLGMLYIWGFFMFSGGITTGADWNTLLESGFFAFLFGGFPGTVIGFIEGWILWWLTRAIPQPMSQATFEAQRKKSMAIMGGLTFLGMGSIMFMLFGSSLFSLLPMLFVILIPMLIASGAATYAAQGYLKRLRAWGDSSEKSKNKTKHEMKNNLAYEDSLSDNTLEVSDSEHQARMKQD